MSMSKTIVLVPALVIGATLCLSSASAEGVNLAPNYQIRPQTDSERLQNFKAPGPAPTNYPNISGGDRGDPRLNVTPSVSLGGNVTRNSAEGNVRFPIPGTR